MGKEENNGKKLPKNSDNIHKGKSTGGSDNMNAFAEFLEVNRDVIHKVASLNTVRNKDGLVVITKDDQWREEKEWDEMLEETDDDKNR